MTGFGSLVVPMFVSAIFVFVISSIIHMGPFWHRSDYPKVPNEDKVMDALRPLGIPQGEYMVPRASSHAEMRTEAFLETMKKGPVLILTVLPSGIPGMAASLTQWFLYSLVVSFFAAYIAGRALPPAAHYLEVFRFAGATAFIGYSVALWQMAIWYKRSWAMTCKATVDGLIYASFTAGVFGWLWPR